MTIVQEESSKLIGTRPAIAVLLSAFAAAMPLLTQDATAQAEGQNRVFSSGTNVSASSKAAAEKLARIFPEFYWYASDAWLRETTRHGFCHPQKHDEFVNTNEVTRSEHGLKPVKPERSPGK